MTAQFNDTFRYRDTEYSLAGISEGELFDVSLLGLEPQASSTACWRGYLAIFSVVQSRLVLDSLYVNLFQEGDGKRRYQRKVGPVINGITPSLPDNEDVFLNNYYERLNYHLEYSGGLLLADDFILDLYVHMGFHPPWKYRTVIELVFEQGILMAEYDRSDFMAELRERIVNASDDSESRAGPTDDEIHQFIDRAFDRSYPIL